MRASTRLFAAVVTVVMSATAAAPLVNRDTLASLEKSFDDSIFSQHADDPFDLLGNTRGVYLDDYGAVFTAEVNLVAGAVMTPFRPQFTDKQKEELRKKKVARLAEVKALMRRMLVESAVALKTMPPDQQIVVGVSLFYYSWEKRDQLPSQIVMQAGRKTLVAGRDLDTAIRVQEF